MLIVTEKMGKSSQMMKEKIKILMVLFGCFHKTFKKKGLIKMTRHFDHKKNQAPNKRFNRILKLWGFMKNIRNLIQVFYWNIWTKMSDLLTRLTTVWTKIFNLKTITNKSSKMRFRTKDSSVNSQKKERVSFDSIKIMTIEISSIWK